MCKTIEEAQSAGHQVWATVLRKQQVRMVPGADVKPGELLSWTCEGWDHWVNVGKVVYRRIGSAKPSKT